MDRKYDEKLIDLIKEKQYIHKEENLDILVKPVPDFNSEEKIDPRVYKDLRIMAFFNRFMPKSIRSLSLKEKNIKKTRLAFNKVDSHKMVNKKISIEDFYIEVDDGYNMHMRAYMQDDKSKKFPILYYIHGGGFFAGSTDVVDEAMRLLVAKYKVVIFSVDYRLAPEYKYPRGHKDTYFGLKWLVDNAYKFGGDSSNIFVAGDSAGGNLAQYCSNKSTEDNLSNIKGQVLLYPVLNFSDKKDKYYNIDFSKFKISKKHKSVADFALNMMEGSNDDLVSLINIKDREDYYISPYLEVNPKLVPTMISVGELDFFRQESIAYAKKLNDLGIDVTTILYRGISHAYLDQVGNYPQSEDCVNEIGKFIYKYSKD